MINKSGSRSLHLARVSQELEKLTAIMDHGKEVYETIQE